MARLEGKVALISGGARGQGAVEARMFAEEGARVVIGDILDDAGRQTEAQLRELGYECIYVHLDVTSEDDWAAAVQAAVAAYGKLDILLNNAGILIRKNIEDTTEADWDRIFAVNAKGVFLGTKAVLPALRANGGGSIINISSTARASGQPQRVGQLHRHQRRRAAVHQGPPPSSTPAKAFAAIPSTPAPLKRI